MGKWTEVMIAYSVDDERLALTFASGLSLSPLGNRIDRMLGGAVKWLNEGELLQRVVRQTWNRDPQVFIRPEGGEFSLVRRIEIINFFEDHFEQTDNGDWTIDREFTAREVAEHAAQARAKFLRKQEEARDERLSAEKSFNELLEGIRRELAKPELGIADEDDGA